MVSSASSRRPAAISTRGPTNACSDVLVQAAGPDSLVELDRFLYLAGVRQGRISHDWPKAWIQPTVSRPSTVARCPFRR